MNLQENIRRVLKEETHFNITNDKYSKLIKKAVLDYVDFHICGLSVSQLESFEDQYLVILIVEIVCLIISMNLVEVIILLMEEQQCWLLHTHLN